MKPFLCKALIISLLVFHITFLHSQTPKIIFAPQWLPQAQFAGYYVAQEKGFYKEAGIAVEIIHPSANTQATELLATGKADIISLFLITGISAKNKGLDLVNIGQISQHSAILFVTKKSRGIDKLAKLNGKKIGIWKSGFDEVPKALMQEKNYNVEWVPILSTVNLFMMDGIDALTVMSYNEYDYIINCGVNEDELNVFPVSDYGYDVPEDGLYCLKSTYEKRKSDFDKFLQATFKGWDYAAANKEFAMDIVLKRMKEAHVPANRVHQGWMLDKVLEIVLTPNKGVKRGELLESDFLKAAGILDNSTKSEIKFTFNEFYKPLGK
ncbi:MAG: ABC transporter substrate-binding protein [Bacteroidales bacterium]|nr:ABC transporter substrate-binding protein [Bacteroidales bacterium]